MADLNTSIPRLSVATLGSARIGTAKFFLRSEASQAAHSSSWPRRILSGAWGLFTEDVLVDGGGDWGIIGASLKRPEQRNRLVPQDYLYTTVENAPNGQKARIVGCLLNVLVGPENLRPSSPGLPTARQP